MRNVARVKEQSSATGLADYSLSASGSLYRRLRDEFASGERVRYYAASAADFEEGIGVLTTGTPDTLSRDTILRSSTGAKINWPAGIRDVFIDPLPGTVPVLSQAGAYTLTAFDHGALIRFTGTTATWTLPAAASVGDGFSFEVRNDGSGDLTLDANGSETINGALTLVIRAGGAGLLRCTGATWFAVSLGAMDITGLTVKTTPVPGADFAPIYDAAGAANKKVLVEKLGRVVQRVYDEERAYSNNTGYTGVPNDDTKPEITEGVEILSATITPTSTSNRIRARAVVPFGPNAALTMVGSIHRGGQALATAMQYANAGQFVGSILVELEETVPATTAQTYSVRLGARGGTGFEIASDGGVGSRKHGGALTCSLVVEEIVP